MEGVRPMALPMRIASGAVIVMAWWQQAEHAWTQGVYFFNMPPTSLISTLIRLSSANLEA
ncbi:hypothetical protein D3C75_960810 [compost metagenome]